MVSARERHRLERPPQSLLIELSAGAVALVTAIAFALSYGLNYGVGNQTGYMLGALRLLDPSVLAADWYAAQATNFHPAFSYLGWFLLIFDRDGWGVGVAFVVTVAAGAMCLYWLAREVLPERRFALAAFLLVMTLAFVTRTRSVAGSYVFEAILQPSALGSLFLLAALPPFVGGRFLMSGVFLALSGLFHANYLVLGIGTFGLAHLVLGIAELKELVSRLLRQLGPALLVLLWFSPLMFSSLGSEDAERAKEILFTIRSPHHYVPSFYSRDFLMVAAWQMLGLGAGTWLLHCLGERGKRLGTLILVFAGVIWGATFFTTWVWIPQVAQIFAWRFAPFLDLLMQFLLCAASVRLAYEPALARRIPPLNLLLVLGGIALMAVYEGPDHRNSAIDAVALVLTLVVLGAVIGGMWRLLKSRDIHGVAKATTVARQSGWLAVVYAVAVFTMFALPSLESFTARSNLVSGFSGSEAELYRWLRANTRKDAVFLTPPEMSRFRIGAERAIVVDWKSSPYVPGDVLEWYRRLEDVSGQRAFTRANEVFAGYARLDAERLEALRSKYHIDYAVIRRGRHGGLPGQPIYMNEDYVVQDLSLRKQSSL